MDAFLHRRPALARQFADALTGEGPFAQRAGVFLAAPRRTGKTTFLRADLLPELAARGVETVYVDLWSDRAEDPGRLIARAVAERLAARRPLAARLARAVRRIAVGGVTVEVAPGEGGAATLPEALEALAAAADRPVALIVDEAQQALSTEAGRAALFALKAARDAMNAGGGPPRLMLVFTGSHRDKLAALVARRDQPFWGAEVTDFPLLGPDYVAAYVAWLNARLAPGNRFEMADVQAAFDLLGARPELLTQVLRDHALGPAGAPALGETVRARAEALRERLWDQYDSDFGALTDLQRAVLARVLAEGPRFAPFARATVAALAAALGRPVATSDVQSALEALRERGLVWRSGRGAYAAEDQGMADWLAARRGTPAPR